MTAARLFLIFLSMILLGGAQESTYVGHYLEPFPGPQAYKDPNSGTVLYVESDGRHVAAISSDGKLLWNRDPHEDAHLDSYRTKNPQIVYIGPPPKGSLPPGWKRNTFVGVSFNNSQFGVLRIRDGDFRFLGQD